MDSKNQVKTWIFWGVGEGFRGILWLVPAILRYIKLFSRYITLFYAIQHYFTLIFDSMVSYLKKL